MFGRRGGGHNETWGTRLKRWCSKHRHQNHKHGFRGCSRKGLLTLLDCEDGTRLRIQRFACSLGCQQRLRELGLLEGECVTLLRGSDPVLLWAEESRIAIDPKTAGAIEVTYEPTI